MIQTIENHNSQIENRYRVLPLQAEERDILKPRQRPSLLDWMQSRYMLSGGTSAVEGLWNAEYTPYFVPVADWLSDTTTREVWIYACAQSGKTTFGTGWEGYIIECSPGPFMLIMSDKETSRERIDTRIRQMFKDNPDLLAHVKGRRINNIFIGKPTVLDNMIMYIGWATTARALADRPVCYMHADETGKYPPFVEKEADPISLMRKRSRWFKGRSKLLGTTTPVIEGDLSDQQFKLGDECDWGVPCVYCNNWHLIVWENVKIERKADKSWYAESIYNRGKHCWYECPHCHAKWTEDDRWKAVCGGKPVPKYLKLESKGKLKGELQPCSVRSITIHALMLHPMVETVRSLVVEFVRAQRAKAAGNIEPLKDFWNSQLARTWREEKATTDIEILKRHIGKYPKGVVPVGVQMLTAGIDVQLDHVYLRIIGWGYLGESFSILDERIETGPTDRVENLVKVIPYLARKFDMMADPAKVMKIAMAGIDRQYNAETVDAFCVRCLGILPVIPVAGDDKLQRQNWAVGKTAGGAIKLYRLNTTVYKDALWRMYFEATVPGPGYGHLHSDTEYDVLEQLTSEKKTIERKGERIAWIGWVLKKTGTANHYWDTSYIARAVADIAGLWSLADPSAAKKTEIPPPGRPIGRRPIRTKY
jgi:phage terminase large subunit GpA-like protein